MSEIIQQIAGNFGANEPVNGSWLQAIYESTIGGVGGGATGPAGTSGTSGVNGATGPAGEGGSGGYTQSYNGASADAVWKAIQFGPASQWASGGIWDYYPLSSQALTIGNRNATTIILRDGETLSSLEFVMTSVVTPGVVDLALYSINKVEVAEQGNNMGTTVGTVSGTYSAYELNKKVYNIGTVSVPNQGEYSIYGLDFVADKNETYNNLYALVLRLDSGAMSSLWASPSIPHIGGGERGGGAYYRTYILWVGNGSSNPESLAGVTITNATGGGLVVYYRKRTP